MKNKLALILLGLPGSGKGTNRKRLGGFHEIETGAVFRRIAETDAHTSALMKEGFLVPDEKFLPVAEELIQPPYADQVILDGAPRTVRQGEFFFERLHEHQFATIYLNCPEDEVAKRLLSRGRVDDTESAIGNRMAEWEKHKGGLLALLCSRTWFYQVNSNQPESVVGHEFLRAYATIIGRVHGRYGHRRRDPNPRLDGQFDARR